MISAAVTKIAINAVTVSPTRFSMASYILSAMFLKIALPNDKARNKTTTVITLAIIGSTFSII